MSPTDVLLTVLTGGSIAPAAVLSLISGVKTFWYSMEVDNAEPHEIRRFIVCFTMSASAMVLSIILTTIASEHELDGIAQALVIAFTLISCGASLYTASLLFRVHPIRDRIHDAVLAEREACAKLADRFKRDGIHPEHRNDQVYREQAYRTISEELAGKIRARE